MRDTVTDIKDELDEYKDSNHSKDEDLRKTFTVLLEGIEEMELQRLTDIKESMESFTGAVKEMRISLFDWEQKLIDSTDSYKPFLDIQSYIRTKSQLEPPPEVWI